VSVRESTFAGVDPTIVASAAQNPGGIIIKLEPVATACAWFAR